jgi:hypothetical protein
VLGAPPWYDRWREGHSSSACPGDISSSWSIPNCVVRLGSQPGLGQSSRLGALSFCFLVSDDLNL